MLRVPPVRKSRIIASDGNHIETFELPPQMMPKVDIIKQTRSSLLNGSQSPVPSIQQLPSIDLFKIMQANTAAIGDVDDASFWSMLAVSPCNSTSSVLISDSNASRNSDTPVSAFSNWNLNSPGSSVPTPPLLRALSERANVEQPQPLVLSSPSLRNKTYTPNKHPRSGGFERSCSFQLNPYAAVQFPSILSQPVHNRSSSLIISSSSVPTNDAHRCSKKHCVQSSV